jgi:hypothetical protein
LVCVRFNDVDNVARCERFLTRPFVGSVERDGDTLSVTLRGELAPNAERAVVERLLWAWRQRDGIADNDGFIVGAEDPADTEDDDFEFHSALHEMAPAAVRALVQIGQQRPGAVREEALRRLRQMQNAGLLDGVPADLRQRAAQMLDSTP